MFSILLSILCLFSAHLNNLSLASLTFVSKAVNLSCPSDILYVSNAYFQIPSLLFIPNENLISSVGADRSYAKDAKGWNASYLEIMIMFLIFNAIHVTRAY